MAEPVVIRIEVSSDTKDIDKLHARLAALAATGKATGADLGKMSKQMDGVDGVSKRLSATADRLSQELRGTGKQANILTRSFDRFKTTLGGTKRLLDDNRRSFNSVGKAARKFGMILRTAGKWLSIGMLVNLAALGLALVSVNAAFAVGTAAVKTWNATMQVAAVGAASVVSVLAALAAGQRQYTAALNAYRYPIEGGTRSQGMNAAQAQLRAVTTNANLAVFGMEQLDATFTSMSRHTQVTAGLNRALTAMGDFAILAQDPAKALGAAGEFLAQFAASGKVTEDMKALAEDIGPAFQRALDDASKRGLTSTPGAFFQALIGGDISGEVAGQLDLVNRTLFGTVKKNMTLIRGQFADIGEAFLPDFTDAIEQVSQIIDSMLVRTQFALRRFAGGSFVDGIVGGTEKVADFSVTLFNKWLPRAEGMMERIGGFLGDMRDWFDETVEALRPLTEGGRVLLDVFGPLVKGLVGGFGGGVKALNDTLIANKESFYAFGDSLANLGDSVGKLMKEIYDGLVKALPTISRIVDTIANVVDLITAAVSALNGLGGAGGMAAMMAPFLLGGGGRYGRGARKAGGAAYSGIRGRMPAGIGGTAAAGAATLGVGVGVPMMLGAPTANQGMLGGAMAGAGAGAMFGPWGALIGGLGGGAVGGIMGMLNQGKNARERARNESLAMFTQNMDEFTSLLVSGQGTGAKEAFASTNEQFELLIEASERLSSGSVHAYDEMKAYAQSLLDAGKITEEQYKILLDRDAVGEYNKKLKEQFQAFKSEATPALRSFDDNIGRLSRITGKTENEVMRLAETLGIDLTNGIDSVSGAIQQMLEIQIPESMEEARRLGRDRMLQLLDDITLPIIERQGHQEAVDQAVIDLQGMMLGGTATSADFAEFMRTAVGYEMATNEDPLVAIANLNRMIGPGGLMFQEGSRFAGLEGQFAPGQQILADYTSQVVSTEVDNVLGVLAARAADSGLELNIEQISQGLERALSGLSVDEQIRTIGRLRHQGQWWNGNEATLENVLGGMGVRGAAGLVTPMDTPGFSLSEAGPALVAAGQELMAVAGPQLQAAAAQQQAATAVRNGGAFVSSSAGAMLSAAIQMQLAAGRLQAPPDPRIYPLAGGDTPSSRFDRTLASHDALSARIAGSRRVTSGMRNWNLGSINSDHVTGRALDVTGQNLGAYATAMNAAGGFAEFHGAPSNRHLHVVPPSGDTMNPVPSLSMAPSGGTTVNANINVSGAGDPEAVANRVIAKINRIQRTARERS